MNNITSNIFRGSFFGTFLGNLFSGVVEHLFKAAVDYTETEQKITEELTKIDERRPELEKIRLKMVAEMELAASKEFENEKYVGETALERSQSDGLYYLTKDLKYVKPEFHSQFTYRNQ